MRNISIEQSTTVLWDIGGFNAAVDESMVWFPLWTLDRRWNYRTDMQLTCIESMNLHRHRPHPLGWPARGRRFKIGGTPEQWRGWNILQYSPPPTNFPPTTKDSCHECQPPRHHPTVESMVLRQNTAIRSQPPEAFRMSQPYEVLVRWHYISSSFGMEHSVVGSSGADGVALVSTIHLWQAIISKS